LNPPLLASLALLIPTNQLKANSAVFFSCNPLGLGFRASSRRIVKYLIHDLLFPRPVAGWENLGRDLGPADSTDPNLVISERDLHGFAAY